MIWTNDELCILKHFFNIR